MKVKMFRSTPSITTLELSVNSFCKNDAINIKDIKYSAFCDARVCLYSAMIIYEEKSDS